MYRHTLLCPETPVMRLSRRERKSRSLHPLIRGGTTLAVPNESDECVIVTTNKLCFASWAPFHFFRVLSPSSTNSRYASWFAWNSEWLISLSETIERARIHGSRKKVCNYYCVVIVMDRNNFNGMLRDRNLSRCDVECVPILNGIVTLMLIIRPG